MDNSTLDEIVKLPAAGTLEHVDIYKELKGAPNLLRFLNIVIIDNALNLARSELPEHQMDLKYLKYHAQTRGMIMLADNILNLVKEGDVVYGPKSE